MRFGLFWGESICGLFLPPAPWSVSDDEITVGTASGGRSNK
jgi:hypothetical protein